jgi:hypothetical protein
MKFHEIPIIDFRVLLHADMTMLTGAFLQLVAISPKNKRYYQLFPAAAHCALLETFVPLLLNFLLARNRKLQIRAS